MTWTDIAPFILPPEAICQLFQTYGDPDTAASLLKPANEEVLISRQLNRAVGNVRNNSPELV